ncbi:MAG: HlyD family efflux transporter periplasmic adaptor subunit, partial [Planctomycetota bacterium]|nr:HlyD family efflux transporter periplasmic adaptor subunit [Planctomycetota bacterium]
TTRYQLAADALRARVKAQKRTLDAQRIDLERVAQADLAAAKALLASRANEITAAEKDITTADAALRLAKANLDRAERLKGTGAGTQQTVDDARNAFDAAEARRGQTLATLAAKKSARDAQDAAVRTATASISLKEAQVAAAEATLDELSENLKKAEQDVADCVLRAPFPGRITALHVTRGAIVSAGTGVVTLTMVDPMKVSVAVSAEANRQLRAGTAIELYPHEPEAVRERLGPLYGVVIDKGEVADAATRTYRIDIIVRNQRLRIEDRDPSLQGLPQAEFALPAITRYRGEGGDLFVDSDCIVTGDGAPYVLAVGVHFGSGANVMALGKYVPTKIPVTPGAEHMPLARWNFRRLEKSEGLTEGQFCIRVPPDAQKGAWARFKDGVAMGTPEWRLRPGELVPLVLPLDKATQGLYVPVEAIRALNDDRHVFVVEGGNAKKIAVTVHDTFREKRRVEGAGLEAGARVIVDGVHYVQDGDTVTVTQER